MVVGWSVVLRTLSKYLLLSVFLSVIKLVGNKNHTNYAVNINQQDTKSKRIKIKRSKKKKKKKKLFHFSLFFTV